MAELETQVAQVVGQPASVRIGTVASVNPTVVTVQGATFTNVGFLGSYSPIAGDTVAVLGQSPASGTDPTSWLVLGSVNVGSGGSFQAGQVLMTFVTLTSFSVNVTFSTPFLTSPSVVANIASGSGSVANWFTRCTTITPAGFTLLVNGPVNSWTDIPVQWQAQERTQ